MHAPVVTPSPTPHTPKPWLNGLAAMLLLVLLALAGVWQTVPPSPAPASAPADEFSAARAMQHVDAIAGAPRFPGTAGHAAAREYIVAQLRAAGLEPHVQTETVVSTFTDVPVLTATVHNVMARLPGTNSGGKAVMLAGHYDSVPNSRAAGDDAASVGVLLETLRVLQTGPRLRNDVIFLFTDGEDLGLMGARAFVDGHPWAKDVGLVINFDNRGTEGPAVMFEVSGQNGPLMRQFTQAVSRPFTTSLTYAVYQMMPNSTDVTEFKRIPGLAYLNVAVVGGWQRYHTSLDTPANLNAGSVQQMGGYALGVARRFGSLELPVERGSDAIWFNVARGGVLRYPVGLVLPLAIVATVGLVAVLVVSVRQRRLTGRQLFAGLTGLPLAALLAAAASFGLQTLVGHGVNLTRIPSLAWAYGALGGACVLAVFALLRRWAGVAGLLAGALVWWCVLALATAAALPGASYLFVWPVLFGLGALWSMVRRSDENSVVSLGLQTLWALPAALLAVPLVLVLFDGLFDIPAVPTVLLVLLLSLLAGLLVAVMESRWWVPIPLLIAAGGVALGAAFLPPDAGHPATDTAYYGLDADTGKAYWLSRGERTDSWTAQLLGAGASMQQAPAFFPYRGKVQTAAAPVVQLPTPAVKVLDDKTEGAMRTVRLQVTAPGASAVSLHMMPRVDVQSGTVNGKPISYKCPPTDNRCIPWSVTHLGVPAEGVEVAVRIAAGSPLEFRVIAHREGLPGAVKRPPELIPGWGVGLTWPSDTTMVSKQFKL